MGKNYTIVQPDPQLDFLYLAEQNSVLDSVVEIRPLYVQGEEMPEEVM